MMDLQHNALSFDEASAALPHAPLAMPKQVVEVERGRLFAALLASSGYALYYFAPESVRPALGWAHAVVGTAMALLLVWHGRCARQGRSAA